jgi:hypothetical protein
VGGVMYGFGMASHCFWHAERRKIKLIQSTI